MNNNQKGVATKNAASKETAKEAYVSFNKSETAVLRQLDPRCLRLYFELKWIACFKTGWIGPGVLNQRALTYEGLAQTVEIPVRQGASACQAKVDGTEIKRLLVRLSASGLIKDLWHDGTRLRMYLVMSPISGKSTSCSVQAVNKTSSKQGMTPQEFVELIEPLPQDTLHLDSFDEWDVADTNPEKLPIAPEKLPTDETSKSSGNPHEDWASDWPDYVPSVLRNSNTSQYFSVPDPVCETGDAVASPSTEGAGIQPAPSPHPQVRRVLEGGKEVERTMGELEIMAALRAAPGPVRYMFASDTELIVRDMAKMGVVESEFQKAVNAAQKGTSLSITPAAVLRELCAMKKKWEVRRAHGLGGRVAL